MTSNNLSGTATQRLLERLGACPEAVTWAGEKKSVDELWYACPDPEWLLVALKILGLRRDPCLRHFAICCAQRHKALFVDDRLTKILDNAEGHAVQFQATDGTLQRLHDDSMRIAESIAKTQDWDALRHPAIQCVCDALREHPWHAALRASRNGQRASEDPDAEAEWQVCQLRKLATPHLARLADRATRLLHSAGKFITTDIRNTRSAVQPE